VVDCETSWGNGDELVSAVRWHRALPWVLRCDSLLLLS
jgi:hypothetical protein